MSRKIEQTYIIKASPPAVWRALTNPKEIEKWSGAWAHFVPQAGTEYAFWNGDIGGVVVEAVPHKKLVQTWKPENWSRTDSVVTFTLSALKGGTRVDLLHENVEDWDYDATSEGWDVYYLGEIKRMLEARGAEDAKGRTTKSAKVRAAEDAKERAAKDAKTRRAKGAKKKRARRAGSAK